MANADEIQTTQKISVREILQHHYFCTGLNICMNIFIALVSTNTHTHKDNYQNGMLHYALTTHTTQHSKMPDTLLKVRQPSSSSFVILKSYKALHWGIWLGSGVTTCGKKTSIFIQCQPSCSTYTTSAFYLCGGQILLFQVQH